MRLTIHATLPHLNPSQVRIMTSNSVKILLPFTLEVMDLIVIRWSNTYTIVNKANNLGLIKRTVGTANASTFSLLYKSLVRPLLEYAAPVWNPYLFKDVQAIESVQRRASRLALRQKKGHMSYEYRCQILKWPLLSTHRSYFSLVECYKIVFGLSHLDFNDLF